MIHADGVERDNLDHQPTKCSCGSEDVTHETVAYDGSYVSESKANCVKCGKRLGYWAYGYWDTSDLAQLHEDNLTGEVFK